MSMSRAYYASVSFTDWNIGQLLASLTASGAEKETVVVMHAVRGAANHLYLSNRA